MNYNSKFPTIDDLRTKAKKKMPKFSFEYLDGGCNEDISLHRNTKEIREVQLIPRYIRDIEEVDLSTKLFGHTYDAPFGIAPVGLQGLMWPDAPRILAKTAHKHNLPFILSTVSTNSIEEISEITEGRAWFQLYYPSKEEVRKDIIKRVAEHCPVLVLLSDTPTFGFRPRDVRNGLGMPPKMTMENIKEMLTHPHWLARTVLYGKPEFKTLTPYMPKGLSLKHLAKFMNESFDGRLDEERIKEVRDLWGGKLVVKGVSSEEDLQKLIGLGVDGVIASNHGGRQLDAAQSTINFIREYTAKYKDKITMMMDSGVRSGPDIVRSMACGADFTFLGRAFMYSVGALNEKGGEHLASILKIQLEQVMNQLRCYKVKEFPNFLANN